jgi:AraC-like DNA-binding protein
MDAETVQTCYRGSDISAEKFIPAHFFMYVVSGTMIAYDGGNRYVLNRGDAVIARKNHLIRYSKYPVDGTGFEGIVISLDDKFLKDFFLRHPSPLSPISQGDSFISVQSCEMISNFIGSLGPYYDDAGNLDTAFAQVKREELLLILLKVQAGLREVLFNFSPPEKIPLEAFMNRNYRFNIRLQGFAYLSGRSLSAFKRDFYKVFNQTPGNWLTARRLEEAYFQLTQAGKYPVEIYLELGFENLSHFSHAFRKKFGYPPAKLTQQRTLPQF